MANKDNLELWSAVEKTDPKHTKKVTYGRGFTAIDPYYQIKCATEQFGAAGKGWGWEVVKVEKLESIHSICLLIRLWHGDKGDFVEQWGQGSLFSDNAQKKPDHDVMKKATTDGITKCLSYLGFNADVFTGKFDDNKYVQQMNAEFSQINPAPINQERVKKAAEYFKGKIDEDDVENAPEIRAAYGKLTNDEKFAVQDLLKDKVPDTNKMYKSILKDYLEK